jgi:hypothetical protein
MEARSVFTVNFVQEFLGSTKREMTVRSVHGSGEDLLSVRKILSQNMFVKKEIVIWTSAHG